MLYQRQPEPNTYYIGLSLGQLGDRTALSIVRDAAPEGAVRIHECRHLQVWQPGTSHMAIIADIKTMLGAPTLHDANIALAIDMTVAGESVALMYRNALGVPTSLYDIAAGTAGHLPKREIVSLMRALLEQNRFRYATGIEHASTLQTELQHFQVKQVSPDNALMDWRNRPHDDLVIATALACWLLEQSMSASELRRLAGLFDWINDGVTISPY